MSVVFVQAILWKSIADVSSFYSCKSEGVIDILKSQLYAFHWTIQMGVVRPTRQLPQHAEPGSEGFAKGHLQHHVRCIVPIQIPRTAVQKPFHLDFLADTVTPRVNFPWKITFDMLYTNEFVIRVRSRALAIPSEHTTI